MEAYVMDAFSARIFGGNQAGVVLPDRPLSDADYRGELKILLVNLSDTPFVIEPGERIAQLVVAKHEHVEWSEVEVLDETERGEGGFGSTGVK